MSNHVPFNFARCLTRAAKHCFLYLCQRCHPHPRPASPSVAASGPSFLKGGLRGLLSGASSALLGSLLGASLGRRGGEESAEEEGVQDLWFTSLDDFKPLCHMVHRGHIMTAWFAQANKTGQHFVLKKYDKREWSAFYAGRVRSAQ